MSQMPQTSHPSPTIPTELGYRSIPRIKAALFFILLGSNLFVYGSYYVMRQEMASHNDPQEILNAQALGIAAIAFFGFCALAALVRMFSKKPGLVLTDEGFNYNGNVIPWTEVLEIGEYSKKGTTCLVIYVDDPEKYLNKGAFLQRWTSGINSKMTGSPIWISSTDLKIGLAELTDLLNTYLRQSQSRTST